MKQVTVSGAIILRTNPKINKKEIFATQRGYGDYKDSWEIPGGKLEPGETPEQCIEREIREELATEVKAEKILFVWFNGTCQLCCYFERSGRNRACGTMHRNLCYQQCIYS